MKCEDSNTCTRGGRGRNLLSISSFTVAIMFAAAGMWLPPQGEIDSSVLILVAQLLVLCATLLGIKDYTNLINRKEL